MGHKHPILAVLLLSAAPALASPGGGGGAGGGERRPPPDDKAPRELIALRQNLLRTGAERARKDMSRFRALCDADGYPLVGNLANKEGVYQPSQFCAEVRKAGK